MFSNPQTLEPIEKPKGRRHREFQTYLRVLGKKEAYEHAIWLLETKPQADAIEAMKAQVKASALVVQRYRDTP